MERGAVSPRQALRPEQRVELARVAAQLVIALQTNDDAGAHEAMRQIAAASNDGLYAGVIRLTRALHEDLEALQVQTLAQITDAELPDACASLDHVVKLTERAAHRTLDFVDTARGLTTKVARAESREEVDQTIAALRQCLSDLSQEQSFQDLTGQIIRRVISMVRRLEKALVQLLKDSVPAGTLAPVRKPRLPVTENGLPGPAIPGVTPAAASQTEADDLLSDLGL
jgi:chemotaxis protein CheZ